MAFPSLRDWTVGSAGEAAIPHSVLLQAQAAAIAQRDPANPMRGEALLQESDLTTPEATEYDSPPPAYGEPCGEVHAEKDGLGTSASISDDGRVNIRINQLNRRLSQVFTPALRQHVENARDLRPPPPSGTSPPPLNVVMHVVGSRGDVQPFVALGKVLRDTYGHRVRLATHPVFKEFVIDNGLEFFSIGGDPSQLMAFMVRNPALMPGFRSLANGDVRRRRDDVAGYIQGCWRSCYQAGDGMGDDDLSSSEARPFVADCIIANPPSFAHVHCAEKLGIPLHIMFTMPYSPTQAFPHPLANIQSSNADLQLTNYLSYTMIELLSWQGLGDIINRFRARCLALDPVGLAWAPGMLQRLRIPHTYCWSPALVPKPKDWAPHISISGFSVLDSPDYVPPRELKAFLDAGPPPIYIGFGSIVLDDPDVLTELIFQAVEKAGPNRRVLLSKGWGGMGAGEIDIPDNIFMLGNVPHDWLFKQVSCVVHHGGAGTTAAGIAAGRPTVIVPFFGDQPFWGAMVARTGAGPAPIPHKRLTAEKLAVAIDFCLAPGSHCLERAQKLASQVAKEQGSETAAQAFHQHLDSDRLRCTLAPGRAAAWRVRRTKIKLSPFAASTLANASLLGFHDLKLARTQEYEIDGGPFDPITGGFVAACEAFGGMAMGLADLPTETYKAAKFPFKKQQSQASASTIARDGGIFDDTESIRSSTSAKEGRTSFDMRKFLGRVQSAPYSSENPEPTLDIGSSSGAGTSQSQKTLKQINADQMRVRSRDKGVGRFSKALFASPGEISLSLAQGMHNMPKMWNDETVRPQAQITGFTSGTKEAGKQFGLGWYDAISGLATLPWIGARKEGATGFVKGVGKGIGGFVPKSAAGTIGIVGYTMKGMHKGLQKLFATNVQDYIVMSRTAQGYEEWLHSSEAEKQDVIARWGLIQKYLRKKKAHSTEDMVRDVLNAQQQTKMSNEEQQDNGPTATLSRSTSLDASTLGVGNVVSDVDESPSLADWSDLSEFNEDETIRPSIDTTRSDLDYNGGAVQTAHRHHGMSQQSRRSVQTMDTTASIDKTDRMSSSYSQIRRKAVPRSQSSQNNPPHDPEHLSGTTRSEFDAQQQMGQGEKTAEEKTEEQVVLEYVKKQSLLEQQHRGQQRDRRTSAAVPNHEDDEELRRVLDVSIQDHVGVGSSLMPRS